MGHEGQHVTRREEGVGGYGFSLLVGVRGGVGARLEGVSASAIERYCVFFHRCVCLCACAYLCAYLSKFPSIQTHAHTIT